MFLSHFFLCLQLTLQLVVCVVALRYWKRSGQPGFAWFGAAFAAASIRPLLDWGVVMYWAPGRVSAPAFWYILRVVPFLSMILLTLFTLLGLRAFCREQVSATIWPPYQPLAWRVRTVPARRFFFAMTGLVFVVVGPAVALRGGSLVGAGCTTGLIGLVCLWLAWHPKTPLRRPAAGRPDEKSVRS